MKQGLSPKLNVVFDVDHTLIFAQDKRSMSLRPGVHPNVHVMRLKDGLEMVVVVREGVYEVLEFLLPFCNFYAYSHGLKDYILQILQILDPNEKFFLKRKERVIAPVD